MTLLDEVMAAQGGLGRWSETRQVVVDLRIGGLLLATKLQSPFARAMQVTVDTGRVHAVLRPFPGPGRVGVFDADCVRIESAGDGRVIQDRRMIRDAGGHVPRRLIWDHLDLLYFLGYALWNYTVTPFVFSWPRFECREAGPWPAPDGSTWRRLDVRYPPEVPTHGRDQTFYFDEAGLLRRLDYTAEVFGPRARGAHVCDAHRAFDGFVWPTHRVVHPRFASGAPFRAVRLMEGWITSAAVRFADPARAT